MTNLFKQKHSLILLLAFFLGFNGLIAQTQVKVYNDFLDPSAVALKGLLGDEILSSEKGRLSVLPSWNGGQLIKMFSEEYRKINKTNDWYGEHAGKWMYTTALAVNRTEDAGLKKLLFETADELISYQDKEGYLGSYSPVQRITAPDYTMHHRSWDVWNLTYMTLGFLKINEFYPNDTYKDAALKIGELLLQTFGDDKADITDYGTRHGFSSTIVLEAAIELYKVTNDERYVDFGEYVIRRINNRPGLMFFPMMEENRSLELIGDGKIYQSIWNMYNIAKFYEIKPTAESMAALEKAWTQITRFHLNPSGGPWGGVAKHLECFNARVFFSPYGLVETCSTMSWIHFNKQMLRLTGQARFAQEIEKSAYNELLAAKFPNGVDWSYHSFSNGCRHEANFNDCCPSSGALALEELSTLAYSLRDGGIAVNLYSAGEAEINLPKAKKVTVTQETNYPFEGKITIKVKADKAAEFPLFLRIPDWAEGVSITINSKEVDVASIKAGSFFKANQKWKKNNTIELDFPMKLRSIRKVEKVEAPQSKYNIYAANWISFSRGPLVYAFEGLVDGTDRERQVKFPTRTPEDAFKELPSAENQDGVEYLLEIPGIKPMQFMPYYRTGERVKGTWRTTWLQTRITY